MCYERPAGTGRRRLNIKHDILTRGIPEFVSTTDALLVDRPACGWSLWLSPNGNLHYNVQCPAEARRRFCATTKLADRLRSELRRRSAAPFQRNTAWAA
jgi:hypothetical protein